MIKSKAFTGGLQKSGKQNSVAQAGSFLPIPTTGLVGWFIADTGIYTDVAMSTPATLEGATIAGWADQSGAGNHLTQSVPGSRPVLNLTAKNGHNALLLNGKFMALSSTLTMNACTIFAVANPIAASCIWVSNGDDTTSYLYTSNVVVFKPGATSASTATGPSTGVFHLAAGKTDGANCTAYYNAAAPVSAVNTDDFVWKRIGYYNGSALINGQIAEIIVYNIALTDAERATIAAYLNTKYVLY